jgi:ubiquinone/menaquinone biosynthesis C-methylase UbiE
LVTGERDLWAEWLLHRRHGGDKEELQRMLDFLYPVRDKVLANARIAEGETLLDIGAGDGLIAFGAIEQIGEHGQIIFSDVSEDLLDIDQSIADQMGIANQCRFVRAPAEDLSSIAGASVDVVTTRSVLIYVADKQRAFEEFFRVLRPAGRISLFEPINRMSYAAEPPNRFWGYDVTPVEDIAAKVRALYRQRQPLDEDSMLNFDERDLLAFAEQAGFAERHLEFRADTETMPPRRWETLSQTAFNPRMPTLTEAMAEVLTPAETERFVAYLKPLVEQGGGTMAFASAYLWAVKH